MKYLISLSGGKDSTACLLWALKTFNKEDIIPYYIDTKWEHEAVYEYLDYLEEKLEIKIKRIESIGMEELSIREKMIPNRFARFCTRELKIKPALEFYKTIEDDFINIVGIRREESESRKDTETFFLKDGIKTLCPIAYWDTQRVFDFHKDNGLEVNSLYKKGYSRVGCFPCVFARKHELMMMEDKYIDRVKDLEKKVGAKFFAPDVEKHLRKTLDIGMENQCVNQYGICE